MNEHELNPVVTAVPPSGIRRFFDIASTIKDVVDRYRAASNPLEYVVLVGNDDVIPFFRYPDPAPLGKESEFIPPVLAGPGPAQPGLPSDAQWS